MRRCFACLLSGVLVLSLLLSGCGLGLPQENQQASAVSVSLEEVPAYSGSPYVELDGNQPGFSLEERTTDSFETYSTLDALGRWLEAPGFFPDHWPPLGRMRQCLS